MWLPPIPHVSVASLPTGRSELLFLSYSPQIVFLLSFTFVVMGGVGLVFRACRLSRHGLGIAVAQWSHPGARSFHGGIWNGRGSARHIANQFQEVSVLDRFDFVSQSHKPR